MRGKRDIPREFGECTTERGIKRERERDGDLERKREIERD